MTAEQIQNWRGMLALDPQIGVYAFIMPAEDIEKLVEHFQAQLDATQSLPLEVEP